MKNRNLFLMIVIIEILSIASAWAFYAYSNQEIDDSAKNSAVQSNISVYIQNESKTLPAVKNSSESEFVINDSEIVIKNLTISLQGLKTDEKISRLRTLEGKLPSYNWLSDNEKDQARSLINRQYLKLQQNDDYGQIPTEIAIGHQVIKLHNAPDYYTAEVINITLANFPAQNIAGIYEIDFNETPVNPKTGKHYPMYYWDGKITVRPGFTANSATEDGDTLQQKLSHEIGHNVIVQGIISRADLNRFAILHDNKSDTKNFLTKYAKEEGFEEDFSESASFWRGNTPLFCKISKRNSVMQEKFLITAKQFCRNNLCTAYISSGAKDELSENFTAKENIYRGLFWYDLKSQNIKIENPDNFSEFAEKLNCK